jgi:hypothetical protein
VNDLNTDARRLVDLARDARTPGAEDKLRIAERLALPLAGSAAVVTTVSAGQAAAGTTLLAGLGVKIAALLAVGALGGAIVVGQLEPERSPSVTPIQQAGAEPAREPPQPRLALDAPDPALEKKRAEAEPQKSAVSHGSKPSDDLGQEAALLHQAQSAWRAGQSAQALRLANQHAQRFPRSQLANERDVLRVLSLCKLGQVQAARQVGARLLSQAKGSPWYQSVAGSCAAN